MKNMEILHNFFVIEGLDGAGTTTQRDMIAKRAKTEGLPVFTTGEPTGSPAGKLIRAILSKEVSMLPESLAMLFAADRHEHIMAKGGVMAAINAGRIVVSDRYLFSSLAYQSLSVPFEIVAGINSRFPLPEAVFFLDTPPEVCEDRRHGRGQKELFDDLAVQKQVRQAYLRAFTLYEKTSMEIIMIDGNLTMEKIHDVIWKRIGVVPIVKG